MFFTDENIGTCKNPGDVLEKVRKILALSEKGSNNSDAEAEAALLKAQELMAKYNISIEQVTEATTEIKYAHETCTHKWDMGFRKDLAPIIATNFRCHFYLRGKNIVFVGRDFDARIAREAFEYAYEFALRGGNKQYNRAYQVGRETRGVFNSYVAGFLVGLRNKLGEQSAALMIITPPDVNKMFDDLTAGWKSSRGGGMRMTEVDSDAFKEGVHDGRTVMDGRRLEK